MMLVYPRNGRCYALYDNPPKLTNALLQVMKIRLPQAIIRTLTAAAVLVSTPLAVTIATGSFFAGTASAAVSVERTGGDFSLKVENGKLVSQGNNSSYDGQWSISENGSELLINADTLLYNKFLAGKAFTTDVTYGETATTGYESLIKVAVGDDTFHEFKLYVQIGTTINPANPADTIKTQTVYLAGYDTEGNFASYSSQSEAKSGKLTVGWDGDNGFTASGLGSTKVTTGSGTVTPTGKIVFNLNYITSFTVNIAQNSIVHYGNNLSQDYGSGTVLVDQLGKAAAIVLDKEGNYEVLNSTNQDSVREADVYIGGGAQLKITSNAGAVNPINVAGNKTIFIDSTGSAADLILSSTSDQLAGVNLGNVTLVGKTSTIALSGGAGVGKIALLGSIKEEANETVDGGRTLIITSADNQFGSSLTLGDSNTKVGSIDVGTLELQGTTVYLNGKGSVQAGAVTVTKGDTTGELTNVVMSGSGTEATLSGYGSDRGTVKNANVTVNSGTVSNLKIDHSTITLSGAGSVLGGVAASPAVSTLAEGDVPAPSPTTIDNSTINLADGTSIGKGTKVSNSTISIGAGASGVKVSGDLQADIIELKNACSLTVEDAVLGTGTKFVTAQEATLAEGSASAVALTNSTVVLGQSDLTKIEVLADPRGVEIFSDKLANVTSVSNITLSFTRDLIEYLENQLGGKGSLHYVKINFTGMNLSGSPQEGWVTGLAGEIPTDGTVEFASSTVSSGNLVTGIVTLGPSVAAIPEPTSATLSLLSLAAIAARRRRKR